MNEIYPPAMASKSMHVHAGFLHFTLGPVKRSKSLLWRYAAIILQPMLTVLGYLLGQSFVVPASKVCPEIGQSEIFLQEVLSKICTQTFGCRAGKYKGIHHE